MTKAKACEDFRMDHLKGDALKVAKVICKVLGKDADGGGCRAFYTPEEWKARKEKYGCDSVLVLVHDGGDLAPLCNWDYGCYEMSERLRIALEKAGFYYDQCTCWYSAVYPINPRWLA